ncbi:MAG TPA: hypothetical protein VG052_03855 [Puia sp.]|nr:hypothetical protein [Puia sp.]
MMKHTLKNVLSLVLFLGTVAFSLSSCYEGRYYNHYHHHTHGWYDRRHTPPPAGVRWDVDVDLH